eukprot:595489-Karenia_brevis.AAC.1
MQLQRLLMMSLQRRITTCGANDTFALSYFAPHQFAYFTWNTRTLLPSSGGKNKDRKLKILNGLLHSHHVGFLQE